MVLEQQVKRMLADPRSDALVDNFANQWLKLGKIVAVKPDEYVIRNSMKTFATRCRRKRDGLSRSQLHDDRSVVDLLSADYTFVNDRLARHYGIPDVYGNQFRRVTFKDGSAAGSSGRPAF